MTLALDGHSSAQASSTNSIASSVTTSSNQGMIIALVLAEAASNPVVSGVSATGLTFAQRTRYVSTDGQMTEIWWAKTTSPVTSLSVRASFTGSFDDAVIFVFGVSGNPSWDSSPSLPATATGAATATISTSSSNGMVIAVVGNPRSGNAGTPMVPSWMTQQDILNNAGATDWEFGQWGSGLPGAIVTNVAVGWTTAASTHALVVDALLPAGQLNGTGTIGFTGSGAVGHAEAFVKFTGGPDQLHYTAAEESTATVGFRGSGHVSYYRGVVQPSQFPAAGPTALHLHANTSTVVFTGAETRTGFMLVGSGTIRFSGSGQEVNTESLNGSGTITFTGHAAAVVDALEMAGTGTVTFTSGGTPFLPEHLASVSTATFTGSTGSIVLSTTGTGSVIFTGSGELGGSVPLASTATVTFTGSATEYAHVALTSAPNQLLFTGSAPNAIFYEHMTTTNTIVFNDSGDLIDALLLAGIATIAFVGAAQQQATAEISSSATIDTSASAHVFAPIECIPDSPVQITLNSGGQLVLNALDIHSTTATIGFSAASRPERWAHMQSSLNILFTTGGAVVEGPTTPMQSAAALEFGSLASLHYYFGEYVGRIPIPLRVGTAV